MWTSIGALLDQCQTVATVESHCDYLHHAFHSQCSESTILSILTHSIPMMTELLRSTSNTLFNVDVYLGNVASVPHYQFLHLTATHVLCALDYSMALSCQIDTLWVTMMSGTWWQTAWRISGDSSIFVRIQMLPRSLFLSQVGRKLFLRFVLLYDREVELNISEDMCKRLLSARVTPVDDILADLFLALVMDGSPDAKLLLLHPEALCKLFNELQFVSQQALFVKNVLLAVKTNTKHLLLALCNQQKGVAHLFTLEPLVLFSSRVLPFTTPSMYDGARERDLLGLRIIQSVLSDDSYAELCSLMESNPNIWAKRMQLFNSFVTNPTSEKFLNTVVKGVGWIGLYTLTYLSAWLDIPLEQLLHSDVDRDQVRAIMQSSIEGSFYVHGEAVQLEENEINEFKAAQWSGGYLVTKFRSVAQQYIVGFLNSKGGLLLFGIADSGHVLGLELSREDRDRIRCTIDTMGISPSFSHLVDLSFIPVLGAHNANTVVISVKVKPGDQSHYHTKSGDFYIRRKGGLTQLKGQKLKQWIERKLKCDTHHSENLRYMCKDCNVQVCAVCLLEGSHKGHQYNLDEE